MRNGSSSYSDLRDFGVRAANNIPFAITLSSGMPPATDVNFTLTVSYYNGGENASQSWNFRVLCGMNGSFESGDFAAWNVSTASTGGIGTPYKDWMVSHLGDLYDSWFEPISPPAGLY